MVVCGEMLTYVTGFTGGPYNAMPFIPIPHAAELVAEFTVGGTKKHYNVLGYTKPSFVQADMQALATEFLNLSGSLLMPSMHTSVMLTGIAVVDIRSEGAPAYVHSFAPNGGAQGGDLLPLSKSLVITHRTQKRGRSYRGRTYLTGFSEFQQSAGVLVDIPTQTAITSWALGLKNTMATIGWTFCVFSRQHNKVVTSPGTAEPVTVSVLRNTIMGDNRKRTRRP